MRACESVSAFERGPQEGHVRIPTCLLQANSPRDELRSQTKPRGSRCLTRKLLVFLKVAPGASNHFSRSRHFELRLLKPLLQRRAAVVEVFRTL